MPKTICKHGKYICNKGRDDGIKHELNLHMGLRMINFVFYAIIPAFIGGCALRSW